MIKMDCTGSRSFLFNFKDTAISQLEIRLSFCLTCFMMELIGNFKKLLDQSFVRLDSTLLLKLLFKEFQNNKKILKSF